MGVTLGRLVHHLLTFAFDDTKAARIASGVTAGKALLGFEKLAVYYCYALIQYISMHKVDRTPILVIHTNCRPTRYALSARAS